MVEDKVSWESFAPEVSRALLQKQGLYHETDILEKYGIDSEIRLCRSSLISANWAQAHTYNETERSGKKDTIFGNGIVLIL